MGFHFQHRVQLFPGFRINLSEHGAGFSVGNKAARYSHSATGRRTVSTSIPGSGLSWSQNINASQLHHSTSKQQGGAHSMKHSDEPQQNNRPARPPQGPGSNPLSIVLAILALFVACSSAWPIGIVLAAASVLAFVVGNRKGMQAMAPKWSIALIIFAILCACHTATGGTEHANTTTESPATSAPVISSTADSITSATASSALDIPGNALAAAPSQESAQPSSEAGTSSEAGPSTNASAPAVDATDVRQPIADESNVVVENDDGTSVLNQEPANETANVDEDLGGGTEEQTLPEAPDQTIVYVSDSGTKYHSNPNCSNMNNPKAVTLSEAEAMGREACKKCY